MSAILSADDLNDFISPGVACIKPIETLPRQRPEPLNPWEVTTEENLVDVTDSKPAQISLTDCLACSGCVTSAEAVLVSLQSHQEVLNTLDSHRALFIPGQNDTGPDAKLFIASVSPQARASLAATYDITEREAGNMIEQLLSGNEGLRSGGTYGSGFTWVIDTNRLRSLCHAAVVEEVMGSIGDKSENAPKLPVLASACPGWICYAEKTHPHILPHLSRLKSPQALAGTLLKSVLSSLMGISPDKIWHLAIMPCFDKKLEASREELTDTSWMPEGHAKNGVRDVDCVITARELVMLADSRGISIPRLPRRALAFPSFPDSLLDAFLFPKNPGGIHHQLPEAGPSGGYAYQILQARQALLPGSEIKVERGRNLDVLDYVLFDKGEIVMRTARFFGFRNIQNLVRKLKPQRKSRLPGARLAGAENRRATAGQSSGAGAGAVGMECYAYIEVMACPGGCTNGGGQIKLDDVVATRGIMKSGNSGPVEQKEWLTKVDEAYYSANSSGDEDESEVQWTTKSDDDANAIMRHWSSVVDIPVTKLAFTTYRQVESDVGRVKGTSDMERVAGLASTLGGGW